MAKLSKEFGKLLAREANFEAGIPVSNIPKVSRHKLGISKDQQPVFFILCDGERNNGFDTELDLIRVEFSRKCELITEKNASIKGQYTIITLKPSTLDIQTYFLDIIYLMLLNLPAKLEMSVLQAEIRKIVSLFSRLSAPQKKSIQGLWAELLVIRQSSDPSYLIRAWHQSSGDKYDFNDGIDKIEVKSTSKSRRVHTFSMEQLNPNASSQLLIASVMVIETGKGKSIFDIISEIESQVEDTGLTFRLWEIAAEALGNAFEKAREMFFDYPFAADNLSFYTSEDIPKISADVVPKELSNICFDCDLTGVTALKHSKTKSQLHKKAI